MYECGESPSPKVPGPPLELLMVLNNGRKHGRPRGEGGEGYEDEGRGSLVGDKNET